MALFKGIFKKESASLKEETYDEDKLIQRDRLSVPLLKKMIHRTNELSVSIGDYVKNMLKTKTNPIIFAQMCPWQKKRMNLLITGDYMK